ncbi:hypothetical protein Q8A73_003876 [Channa argus]|nr:hypothetical protein Q8A73_003876 [Channa argus]
MEVFTRHYSTAFSSSSTPTPPPQPTAQPSSPSPSQLLCPDGWEVFQGRCYNFVNQPMSWPEAQSNCALLESTLASVHSPQEYNFLQQFTNMNGNDEAWLGGFYLQYQWLWLDGSWFYNNSWINESPESSNPCLLLNSNEPWSNSPCDTFGSPAICVKNSNVPPGMVCPEGWTGFQGRCYHYNTVSMTWPEAEANCASLGASLVSVHSPQEYMFLYQQSSSPSWLGGFYIDDQWMWLDGSWFYQGFFGQTPPASTYQCISTFSPVLPDSHLHVPAAACCVHAGSINKKHSGHIQIDGANKLENKGALANKKTERHTERMKPRRLLSTVDRLPTITEMHERDREDGDQDSSSHTMEEFMDSIKELSQPASYPLHGPLRGHHYWVACRHRVAPSIRLNVPRMHSPWISVDLSDVFLTLMNPSNCDI